MAESPSGIEVWRARLIPHWPIAVVLCAGLFAGLVLGNDYGMSWDEQVNANVGADALRAYVGSKAYFSDPGLADHGPAYFMIQSLGSLAIAGLLPKWTIADGRHLMNYLTFLVAVLCLYTVCLRLMRPVSAGIAAAMFATQPLLLGNAFVNQKDIPFLSFFLAVLAIGLAAADHWGASGQVGAASLPREESTSLREVTARARAEWKSLSAGRRRLLCAIVIAAVLLLADLFFVGTIRQLGRSMVVAAHNGEAPAAVQWLFARMAAEASQTPLTLYLAKYDLYYTYLLVTLTPLLFLGILVLLSAALPSIGEIWGYSWKEASRPKLLASAVLLGLTISIRQVGAFAGGLVSLVMLYRGRGRALFPLVVYWVMAVIVSIVTWPYLWHNPYSRFIGSLFLATEFPGHSTLFQGHDFGSGQLPWNYFPTLAGLQLTEPALVLLVLGLGIVLWRLTKKGSARLLLVVLGLWVGIPLAGQMFFGMAVYGIRHLLFVFPPLFALVGVGFEAASDRLRKIWAQIVLCGVILFPGIWGSIELHPYEYIYFNTLAGGVSGAYGEFEMDRWCISYREAIEYVNAVAEPNSVVVVPQQTNQVVPFARPDLRLMDLNQGMATANFVVSCIWRDAGDWSTKGFKKVYEVRRDEAILTEVWQREGKG